MKHLKLYEGYLDRPEYQEIERDDFLNLFYRNRFENLVTISPNVQKRIGDKIPDNVTMKLINTFPKRKEQSIHLYHRLGKWETTIYELQDEWFVVSDDNQFFFKCDGTTGLLKCLKDRSIIS